MKKLLMFAFGVFISVPAFAETAAEPDIITEKAADYAMPVDKAAAKADEFKDFDKFVGNKNDVAPIIEDKPAKPWWRGWQVGVGVPLMLPATGYNGFIGYMNKKAESWWWRRLGARFDFQIPSALTFNAALSGNGNGYDVDGSGKILFFKPKFDGLATIDPVEYDDDYGTNTANLDGANIGLSMKNQYIGGLIDIYPFGDTWFLGGWRLSGGYYMGEANIDLAANISNDLPSADGFVYNAGNNTQVAAKLKGGSKIGGKMNWKYSGPYAGIGFDLGFFWGIKLYMDAGVVFAKAPQMRDNGLYIPERSINACIRNNGVCDEWISIDIRDPNGSRDKLLAQVVENLTSNPVYGGDDFTGALNNIPNIPDDILNSITGWLGSGNPSANRPQWVDDLLAANGGSTDLADIISDIESAASGNNADFDLQGLTNDYLKARRDSVNDINDGLKELKFVPMIRLGFMKRF